MKKKKTNNNNNTRSQYSSSVWRQERAFRITASKFGEVGARKAPINKIFLRGLFSSTKAQTQAMKYCLESEPMVVKEFKEVTGPQVINAVC